MFKTWKYTLFFLLCLVIALAINLPLAQLLPWVKLPDNIHLDAVEGTVIEGRAQQVMINQFPLRGVRYRLIPSCMVKLKVCYRIDYDQGHLRVAYDLVSGDTGVSNSRIDYPVATLLAYMPQLLVMPAGSLELEIDELILKQGKPASVAAKLVWRNLGVDDAGAQLDIGDYQVGISGNSSRYDLELSDLDASLDVAGKGQINAGVYSLDVSISSDKGIDPQLKNVLELFARKTGHDKYHIQQSGRLPAEIAKQLF